MITISFLLGFASVPSFLCYDYIFAGAKTSPSRIRICNNDFHLSLSRMTSDAKQTQSDSQSNKRLRHYLANQSCEDCDVHYQMGSRENISVIVYNAGELVNTTVGYRRGRDIFKIWSVGSFLINEYDYSFVKTNVQILSSEKTRIKVRPTTGRPKLLHLYGRHSIESDSGVSIRYIFYRMFKNMENIS